MSTVLVAAAGHELEALLGDLVLFAGFTPLFGRDDETPADALERRRPDLVLLDTAVAAPERARCEEIARVAGVRVVYFGSSMSTGELSAFAQSHGAAYFPLPNGPKLLASVLTSTLACNEDAPPQPPHEIVTALRAIVMARRLVADANAVVERNRELRSQKQELLGAARSGRDQLRAAILAYTQLLRGRGISRERAAALVQAAVREGAEVAGAPEALPSVATEAAAWVDEVYVAA